jgi:hypothetical protein
MYSDKDFQKKYLKYKKKYINLKNKMDEKVDLYNLVGGTCSEKIITINQRSFNIDDPDLSSVKIDDYYFKIIFKLMFNDKIGFLIISSLDDNFNEYEKFIVYKSQSELDLQRLFYVKNTIEYDCATQTLIDLRLQKFICNSEDKLIYKNYLYFDESIYLAKMNEIGVITDDIKNNIDDITRILGIDLFINSSKNQYDIEEDKRSEQEIYLQEFSNQIENNFDANNSTFLYSYKRKIDETKDEIDETEDTEDEIEYKKEDEFLMSVFSIDLIDKHNEEKFILYFMIYNDLETYENDYLFDNSQINNKHYFAPITIVPYNEKITKYGLIDKFIKTENYTYNPIKYILQINNILFPFDTKKHYEFCKKNFLKSHMTSDSGMKFILKKGIEEIKKNSIILPKDYPVNFELLYYNKRGREILRSNYPEGDLYFKYKRKQIKKDRVNARRERNPEEKRNAEEQNEERKNIIANKNERIKKIKNDIQNARIEKKNAEKKNDERENIITYYNNKVDENFDNFLEDKNYITRNFMEKYNLGFISDIRYFDKYKKLIPEYEKLIQDAMDKYKIKHDELDKILDEHGLGRHKLQNMLNYKFEHTHIR